MPTQDDLADGSLDFERSAEDASARLSDGLRCCRSMVDDYRDLISRVAAPGDLESSAELATMVAWTATK